jgi:hypothetical protein
MHSRNTQRGATFWGLLFFLAVLGFFLFLGFKLFPPYLDDFKVKAAMDSLAKQPDVGSLSRAAMVESLRKRFDIDMITGVDPAKYLAIEQRPRTRVIRFDYQVVVPLMFNVSALLEFEHAREVRGVE